MPGAPARCRMIPRSKFPLRISAFEFLLLCFRPDFQLCVFASLLFYAALSCAAEAASMSSMLTP